MLCAKTIPPDIIPSSNLMSISASKINKRDVRNFVLCHLRLKVGTVGDLSDDVVTLAEEGEPVIVSIADSIGGFEVHQSLRTVFSFSSRSDH